MSFSINLQDPEGAVNNRATISSAKVTLEPAAAMASIRAFPTVRPNTAPVRLSGRPRKTSNTLKSAIGRSNQLPSGQAIFSVIPGILERMSSLCPTCPGGATSVNATASASTFREFSAEFRSGRSVSPSPDRARMVSMTSMTSRSPVPQKQLTRSRHAPGLSEVRPNPVSVHAVEFLDYMNQI